MKFLLAVLLSSAYAQAPTLKLAEVLKEAEARNPEIRAAKEAWDAARAESTMELWPMLKPQVAYERMYDGEERNWVVSGSLPFPTTLYYGRRARRFGADAAYQAYVAKRLDISARAREAFAMYFLSDRTLALLDENIELMRSFARSADARYAAGKAGQSEPLKASVELSRMLNMRITEEQDRRAAQAMLNALLDRDPASDPGSPEEPAAKALAGDVERARSLALERRPELRAAAAMERRARAETGLARSDFLPEVMLLYRKRRADDPAMDGTSDAMVGLSLPLWFGRQSASVRRAKAEHRMTQAELTTMRNMTAAEATAAFIRAETSLRLIEVLRTSVLPQAAQSLEVAQAAYRSDKGSFLDLLDSQRSLLESKKEYFAAVAEAQVRLGQLERLAGPQEDVP